MIDAGAFVSNPIQAVRFIRITCARSIRAHVGVQVSEKR